MSVRIDITLVQDALVLNTQAFAALQAGSTEQAEQLIFEAYDRIA